MLQVYWDETEELLLRAEDCIIRLENEYSPDDVNELFRIAHTIKGSSHVVGYEDVGNLMHKLEDMLDYARKGSIVFDQSIVSLCFEGIDIVKKMLMLKREPDLNEDITNVANAASRMYEKVDSYINVSNKEGKKVAAPQPSTGIVSSLIKDNPKGKNKYYITFTLEDDAPMVSTILFMIFNKVKEIGTLEYSSVSDDFFSNDLQDNDVKILNIILRTHVEETDLYSVFPLFYIEKMDVINLRKECRDDVGFIVKGRNLVRTFRPEKDDFENMFKSFVDAIDLSSIMIILIDTSQLTIIHENEIKQLIEIKKLLKQQEVELGIIVNASNTKRIINIFDAISPIEDFNIYENEMEAVLDMFVHEGFLDNISRVAKEVYYVQ